MPDLLILMHEVCEGPGLLGDLAREAGLSSRSVLVPGPEAWPDPADFRALVVLGGPQSVYEEVKFPWLKREDAFIRAWLAAKKPYLGICLGAQLLAKALGAKVYPNRQKEIGWGPVVPSPQAGVPDPLFKGLQTDFTAFHWHGDTFDLPAGARHLASSPLTENQAFRHGDTAWGLQFHLEVKPEDIRAWIREYAEEAKDFKAGDYEGDILKHYPAYEAIGRSVFGDFLALLQPAKR